MAVTLFGGMVLDGTGRDGRYDDVHVDSKGVQVESAEHGAESLDCSGLMVAPGFIDTHSHTDLAILHDPLLECKSRQGVCCDVLGQDGLSVAPIEEDQIESVKRQLAGLDGAPPDLDWDWRSVGEYLARIDASKPAIDAAYLVPHGQVRRGVLGMDGRIADDFELARMCSILDKGLSDGAVGFSTGLIYPPCCYADTREIVALCEVVAKHDGVFVVHIRSESDYALESVAEVIEAARAAGCRLCISHIKLAGSENWSKLDPMLDLINGGIASGVEITADQYPYTAGSTMMGAILPPWAHAGGDVLERLSKPLVVDKIIKEMLGRPPQRWDNFWSWSGAEGIRISDVSNPDSPHQKLVGMNLAKACAEMGGGEPINFAIDLLRQENMGVSMIAFSQSESVIQRLFGEKWVGVCTDGLVGGQPHPRTYSAFARALSWMVRERRVVDWPEAVRKMTSLPAESFRLTGLGRIEQGYKGNLVAFDPGLIAPLGGYDNPREHPVGVRHVVVNGVVVVRDGETTGARPGQTIRH